MSSLQDFIGPKVIYFPSQAPEKKISTIRIQISENGNPHLLDRIFMQRKRKKKFELQRRM